MLRRVARASRILLFALGLAALLWLPLSYAVASSAMFRSIACELHCGQLEIQIFEETPRWGTSGSFGLHSSTRRSWLMWPDTFHVPRSGLPSSDFYLIPLWLLAAICLAWPVTSLLLARRRRKGRGFAVEPAADAARVAGDVAAAGAAEAEGAGV